MSDLKRVCLKQTQMPGSTALFTDYLYQFDRVESFYQHPPSAEAVLETAKKVNISAEHRRNLVAALRAQNSEAGKATAANLDLLSQPDTAVIATGQQVGIYTGPVFTLYKALTAVQHAQWLREKGQPAVAVFWLATEDHDFEEVDHTWVQNAKGRPTRLDAKARHSENQPVGAVTLEDTALDALRSHLAGLPFGEEAIALAEQAFSPNVSMRDGFRRLLDLLVPDDGLIFLDPMDPAIRKLAAPLFDKALAQAEDLNEALIERGQTLEAAGYHSQVYVTPETSLLFRIEDGRRIALKRTSDGYEGDGQFYSDQEMRETLAAAPQRFSPNALLRPVTQDFLLPTAAYVAGPAEVAYLAQAEVLYERLLGRMPVVLPRLSLTVVGGRTERLLKRYQLAPTDCFQAEEDVRTKIAERLVPASLDQRLQTSQSEIEKALHSAHDELAAFDPTLGQALDNAGKKILYQFGKVRSKASQEGLRRDSRAQADATYLSHLVWPERRPQERLYSVLSFYARYGPGFVDSVRETVHPDCHDHQFLTL